jgi:hypothetical protein
MRSTRTLWTYLGVERSEGGRVGERDERGKLFLDFLSPGSPRCGRAIDGRGEEKKSQKKSADRRLFLPHL